MTFEVAQKVADAVLYEGYLLYPYRASSSKNQVRWQFGVVAPRDFSEADGSEHWEMQTECLVERAAEAGPGADPSLDVRVRFLRLQRRTLEEAVDAGDPSETTYRTVDRLDSDGEELLPWDEAVEEHLDITGVSLASLLQAPREVPLAVAAGEVVEPVSDATGSVVGRVVRTRSAIDALVRMTAEQDGDLVRVRVAIENRTAIPDASERSRDEALVHALLGAHTLLRVSGGAFVSLIDPPASAAAAAAACVNRHTWPVLIGTAGDHDVMLSSPIILYDYPEIAPESPGELFDATEIDEILMLRIMTLTDEEKREARATDPRARRIIDRTDDIPPEIFERLHGAVRSIGLAGGGTGADASAEAARRSEHAWDAEAPDEERGPVRWDPFADLPDASSLTDAPSLADAPPLAGASSLAGESGTLPPRERLAPRDPFALRDVDPFGREAGTDAFPTGVPGDPSAPYWDPDARVAPEVLSVTIAGREIAKGSDVILKPGPRGDTMDLFLTGKRARVEGVFESVDDETFVAVTVGEDPASDMHSWYGRYFYFRPTELEPADVDMDVALESAR